jgi:hypothetical protein
MCACTGPSRPPIPEHADHLFRFDGVHIVSRTVLQGFVPGDVEKDLFVRLLAAVYFWSDRFKSGCANGVKP